MHEGPKQHYAWVKQRLTVSGSIIDEAGPNYLFIASSLPPLWETVHGQLSFYLLLRLMQLGSEGRGFVLAHYSEAAVVV